jgi:NAD-dependent dihydropyrimidine dehydrogenase PreA subunit
MSNMPISYPDKGIFYLARDKIDVWAARLAEEYTVYFPAVREEKVHFQKYSPHPKDNPADRPVWALERIRAVEPLKGFLFAPRETVARFPPEDGDCPSDSAASLGHAESGTVPDSRTRRGKQLILGAKGCDLMPLQVHQKLYLERDFVDPFYQQRRADTIIISADCPVPESTCFCNLLGLAPYVDSGSDINLTALADGYLLQPMSAIGNELVFGRDKPFRPASDDEVETRDRLRRQAVAQLKEQNAQPWRKDLAEAIEKHRDEKFWRDAGKDCVECYGCLMTCPTCFCYLLYDQATAERRSDAGKAQESSAAESAPGFDRVKVWDACYFQGYARVGGGANARPKMWERFRNRFDCKWMNSHRDFGFHSCSGCGRCYSVCMGKIDIRRILAAV